MTVMALAISIGLIVVAGALALRGVRRRLMDERQSVQGYHRTIETLRHVSEQRVRPLARPPGPPSAAPIVSSRGPAPAEEDPSPPSVYDPEAARVVHQLVSGRSLLAGPSGRGVAAGRAMGWPSPALLGAAVLVVVAGALAFALSPRAHSPGTTVTTTHAPRPVTAPSGSRPSASTTLGPTQASTYTATYVIPAHAAQLELVASGPCWVDATEQANGVVLWTGTLTAGQSHTFPTTATMLLRLGAAANVTMTLGGMPVVLPAGYGSPFDAIFQTA